MKRFILLFSVIALIFTSCSSDYVVLDSIDPPILTVDFSSKTIGQDVTFTVKNSAGEDITAETEIYVNGAAIEGYSFTSETIGSFEVKAKYLGVDSEPLTINFHDGSEINFVKRLLIEDYTGTWCGYCPRVAHAIELVKGQTDKVVAVGIHRASLSPTHANYDPYTYDSSSLEAMLGSVGYPKGYLNRFTKWQALETNNIAQAVNLTQGENPKLGLALSSVVENGTISLDVKVQFGKDFSNLNLVVYVLENGLVHEQHNYTEYYNGEDIIEHFVHDHVLRECITPLLGEPIAASQSYLTNTYTRTFNIPVPATVENASNLEFVAFVTNEGNHALNVRKAAVGESQEFEQE